MKLTLKIWRQLDSRDKGGIHTYVVDDVSPEDDLDADAARLVQGLASAAPSSLRTIKRLVRAAELGALEQTLSSEGAAQIQALRGGDFRDRLLAFAARGAASADRS